MTDDDEGSSNEDMASNSNTSTSTSPNSTDISDLIEAQKQFQENFRSDILLDGIEMAQSMQETIQSLPLEEIARMRREMLQMRRDMEKAMASGVIQSTIQAQRSFVQSDIMRTLIDVQQSLEPALVQLNSSSVVSDVYSISTPTHRISVSQTRTVEENDEPKTDVDEIYSPTSRIHDKLIWDDGEWYRDRTQEITTYLVDYIFWKASQGGEFSNASDEEITVGAAVAALFISYSLTYSSPLSAAGGTAALVHYGRKAAQKRTERKGLDDKFGSEDE